jgi:tetratricopeptide (TPR) repeat protein
LGIALLGQRRLDEAERHFRRALEIDPDHLGARQNLGVALDEQGETREALEQWRDVLRRQPDQVTVLNRCAWVLATSPDASLRNGLEATALAERAIRLTQGQNPTILDTLAAAYAESRRFPEAVQTAQTALSQAESLGNTALAEALRQRIESYRIGTQYRDPRN